MNLCYNINPDAYDTGVAFESRSLESNQTAKLEKNRALGESFLPSARFFSSRPLPRQTLKVSETFRVSVQ